jgi:hypothetical protein
MVPALRLCFLAALIAISVVACSRDEKVVSEDGRFSAVFPGPPKTSSLPVQSGDVTVTMNMVGVENGPASYIVSTVDYPQGTLSGKPVDAAFQSIVDGTVGNVRGTLRSAAPITLGDTTGREVLIDVTAKNLAVHERIFIIGDRLYQVMYGGPAGTESAPSATRFLNSFKLLP